MIANSKAWQPGGRPILGLALLLAAGGCAGPEGQEPQAWSTRDMSVLGRASEPNLHLEASAPSPTSDSGWRVAAVAVLQQAIDSDVPLLRANAIEALQAAPDYIDEAVRRGLADDNRGVRFVAAMTVGKLRLESLTHLLEPLKLDPSESVRAAAIFGLARCERPVDLTPLAGMLMGQDPEVRGNAALVVGELGNPTAVPMLQAARGRPLRRIPASQARIVDLQIAEALVKLGIDEELEGIRASLFVPPEQGELTALACQICGRLGDRAVISNLVDLATRTGDWQQSPEVRMAAASALAALDPALFPSEVPMQYAAHERADLRAQAALTLAAGGRREALPVLAAGLDDQAPIVQVSAAAGILRIVAE